MRPQLEPTRFTAQPQGAPSTWEQEQAALAHALTQYPFINYNRNRTWCWLIGFGEIIFSSAVFYVTLMLVLKETTSFEFSDFAGRVANPAPQDNPFIIMLCVVILVLAVCQFILGGVLLTGLLRSAPEDTLTHCEIWLWGSYVQVIYVGFLLIAIFCQDLEYMWPFAIMRILTALVLVLFRFTAHLKMHGFIKDIRQYFEERRMVLMNSDGKFTPRTGQDPLEFRMQMIENMPDMKRPGEEDKAYRNPTSMRAMLDDFTELCRKNDENDW